MIRNLTLVLLLMLVFASGIHTLTSVNQDIGRHLALGKIIWETKSVPETNLFSYTAPDFPFINHHWFAEVLLFAADAAVGLKGIIVAKALLLAVAFALAFFAAYRKDIAVPALGAGLLAAAILVERTDARPEVLSFVFFGWYLFVLFRFPHSRWVWTLPVVQALWANTHIYFFMGPVTYALFFLGNLARGEYRVSSFWRHPHTLIGMAVIAANALNPAGLEGALYPLRVFDNYGYSVLENQTPFFLRPFGYPQFTSYALFIGVAAVILLLATRWRQWKEFVFSAGLATVTIFLGFNMIRNFPLFALAMMPVGMSVFRSMPWRWISVSWAVPAVLAALIYSVGDNQLYVQAGLGKAFGLQVPRGAQDAVDFYRAEGLKGPVFNNFDIGSFLIWKLPEEKVFIDGRPEAYPADFIQNVYIPMQEDPKLWEKYSKEYGIRTVFWNYQDITPWSQKFLAHITKNPDWPMVYRDNLIVILVKKGD